ncbi:MAG: glycosyl hydrolase [Candidatus Cryptobacteroides sp.]
MTTLNSALRPLLVSLCILSGLPLAAQQKIAPSLKEAHRSFSSRDKANFAEPDELYYPETWFHFIDGNVTKEGIRKDLEAIKGAGLRGVQFFHGGNFGGTWPGIGDPIYCLSDRWTDLLGYTAKVADSLGLRFTMQVCPGWSMAGGPWISEENSMRGIVQTKVDVRGGQKFVHDFTLGEGLSSKERDYRDICVLGFPRPEGETDEALFELESPLFLPEGQSPWSVDVEFGSPTAVRSLEMNNASAMSHNYAYDPGCSVKVEAWLPDGRVETVLDSPVPMAAWQIPTASMTLALEEVCATKVRITISHIHPALISKLRLSGAARKNGWEMQAGRVLYGIPRASEFSVQSPDSYIDAERVLDLSDCMDSEGHFEWDAPEGDWCVLRVGNVNTCMKNGPAPAEAVGWECDKLTAEGADAVFDNYIGKYEQEAVHGLLEGMLLDSWECQTQTWCRGMEEAFKEYNGYELRPWIPALFGYVVGDQRQTAAFLRDWRELINHQLVENFYGRMAQRAHERGLSVQYETCGGDVYPCDPMEYFKYADVPMAEFWHHSTSECYVGSINFKPVRPTASAGHIYGKTRVSAEAFTSFWLTWDEHFWQLKENANRHMAQGISHEVFHTYTHNPNADTMVPGTSFGSNIGTPFLRGQTWWKHMPQFTRYLARCSYMLERGIPSMDVLWYLGDDMDHRPDQRPDYMPGFNYDYCNRDVLLDRLKVRKGRLVTPEGLSYKVIWWPGADVISPETLEKMLSLVRKGAVLVTTRPRDASTLRRYDSELFRCSFEELYGDGSDRVRNVGKGRVYLDTPIVDALHSEGYEEDVRQGGDVDWLHRRTKGADWYFVAPKEGRGFEGSLDFRCCGEVEIWNPADGSVRSAKAERHGKRTEVRLEMERAECCFVVFRHKLFPKQKAPKTGRCNEYDISEGWTLSFPEGWGAPESLALEALAPWKDLDLSDEGRAFSGTATYSKNVPIESFSADSRYILDLGAVEMVAEVEVNGKRFEPLWTNPYSLDITSALKQGDNELEIKVTSTWFNRLVFDAGQEEGLRKTWTIAGPSRNEALRPSGLLGPVRLLSQSEE